MAPTASRRSTNRESSPSPSSRPLPVIAIGIFAAVAAGFAATRSLRRKRGLRSEKDEKHAGSPVLVHEREPEINGKTGLQCVADGIDRACEYANLLVDPVSLVESKKDGLFLQKDSTEEKEVEEDVKGAKTRDGEIWQENAIADGPMRKVHALEEGEIHDGDGELSEIAVKMKASPVLNGDSGNASQRVAIVATERRKEEEEEENCVGAVEIEDTGEDGDDDRSSADQQLYPILMNGRILEFFDEMSDLRDEPDLSTSGGNSLSDSVSECSMQEVSSAPVKPLALADEAVESSWMATKPDFVGACNQSGDQKIFPEVKGWSDGEKANQESEVPEMEDKLCLPLENQGFDSKEVFADSSDVHDVETNVHDGEPPPAAISGNNLSVNEIVEVNEEIFSATSVALESDLSLKVSGEETVINGRVLAAARSWGKCSEFNSKSIEQGLQESNGNGYDVLGVTLQEEAVAESGSISGKVLSDETHKYPCLFVYPTPDNEPSLQSAQEGAYNNVFEDRCVMESEVSSGISHAKVDIECTIESVKDVPGLEWDDEIIVQASRRDGCYVDHLHLGDALGMESAGQTDSKETMGVSTNNVLVNVKVAPTEALTENMTGLMSISLEDFVHEPAVQFSVRNVPMVDSIQGDNLDTTHDTAGWKEDLEASVGNLVASPKVENDVESAQEMPSLESDPLEESLHAEEPALQAGGDDDTISEIIPDDNQDAMHDKAGLRSAGETNLNRMEGVSTDNEVVNSKVLPIMQSTRALPSGPLEEFIGEAPVMHSGGHDIAVSAIVANGSTENNVGIEEVQRGYLPTPLEDSREGNDLRPGPIADKVEHSSAATAGRKEDELAEFGITHSTTDAKEQEIKEIVSADDAINDFNELACPTCPQRTFGSNTRESSDQVFTKGAVALLSRSTFSSKVLTYMPVEIVLICLLIALASLLLQYSNSSLSIQH